MIKYLKPFLIFASPSGRLGGKAFCCSFSCCLLFSKHRPTFHSISFEMMLLWMVLAAFSLLKIQTSGSRFPSADCHGEPENEAFSEFWLHSTAPTAVASNINAQCIAHTREYLTAYRSRSSWAVKSKFVCHFRSVFKHFTLSDATIAMSIQRLSLCAV